MLMLKHRFHGHNSLRFLYQKGKVAYSPQTKLLWLPAKPDSWRAAVVISKKVHKSAVVRNRIRRRIYEQIRLFAKSQPINVDMILIIQDDHLAAANADTVSSELAQLLKKISNQT